MIKTKESVNLIEATRPLASISVCFFTKKKTEVKALNGFTALSDEELAMVDGGASWLDQLNDAKIEHGRTSVDMSGVHFDFGNCKVDIGNIGNEHAGIAVTIGL